MSPSSGVTENNVVVAISPLFPLPLRNTSHQISCQRPRRFTMHDHVSCCFSHAFVSSNALVRSAKAEFKMISSNLIAQCPEQRTACVSPLVHIVVTLRLLNYVLFSCKTLNILRCLPNWAPCRASRSLQLSPPACCRRSPR